MRIASAAYAYLARKADTANYALAGGGGSGDNAWVRVGGDSVLYTIRQLGIARGGSGNILYGDMRRTHTNLGIFCMTGTLGQNYGYATVGGGFDNTASGDHATVAGGYSNNASADCAVGGGAENTAWGDYTTVGGGYGNIATYAYATVGGGMVNAARADYATVGGGEGNTVTGPRATVGGGWSNAASGDEATVGGGTANAASGTYSTVGGGIYDTTSAMYATVGGGQQNTASGSGATVGGGEVNTASGLRATVAGGSYNDASGDYATVAGGYSNDASADCAVGGGSGNAAEGQYSTVGGGLYDSARAQSATVAGGQYNTASGFYATVGGGSRNLASNQYSTVAGGVYDTSAASSSFTTNNNSVVPSGFDNSAAFNGQRATASNQTRVGALSKASGTFTIDHPVDPHGKILNHYFIEGPEMLNIYRGSVVLDGSGRAVVTLPDYFDALNRNPMVQLTGVGGPDVVYVAEKVAGNRFVIGGKPGTEVYWQVTGERQDVSAEITRRLMPVEQPKTGVLAGTMLDDDFLRGAMDQLVREGKAQGIDFRTAAGRQRYEKMKQLTEQR
jgi:hypothetical protein